jgi:Xaa-Pro aminopeptidase
MANATPSLNRKSWAIRAYTWEEREPHLALPFPLAEYEARIAKTRAAMTEQGLEALIVCGDVGHPGDVRWLANWKPGVGNAFLFIPTAGQPTLVLHDEVPGYDLCATWVRDIRPPLRGSNALGKVRDDLVGLLSDHGVSDRLGVVGETGLPTPVHQGILADNPALEIVDAAFLLMGPRSVKSPLEIEMIREAVRQSDAAMSAAIETIKEGVPENRVVGAALQAMFAAGADDVAFMPIAVAGPRAAWKHAGPSSRPIGRGEPVYIDLGASYNGYCADISRTVLLGTPTPEQANVLAFSLAATEAVKQAARPGIPARRLREVGNEVAAEFGLTGRAHGTGHGLGCKLREEPLLDPTNKLLLAPGMTIAIEPMSVSELGTFVVEDDILITETGSEYLSHCRRKNWEDR